MTFPTEPMPVPAVVTAIAAGRHAHAVWVNELGGVTFSIADGAEFVKVYPDEHAALLVAEARRLEWAGRYAAVPAVLGAGPGWLHTAGLPARSAVDPRWTDHPRTAARAIGLGLRHLHDTLPVADCPFGPPTGGTSRLRGRVPADAPPADRLVVCHGDACAPNTLMSDDGQFIGHVDLAELGVADRWADLAIASMSLDWNYPTGGPDGFAAVLFDAYGVTADTERIAYYRRSWD